MSDGPESCPSCGFVGPSGPFTDWHMDGGANCQVLNAQKRRAARAEALIERIVDDLRANADEGRDGYLIAGPRSEMRSVPCDHGKYGWEDCADCEVQSIADWIERLATPAPGAAP